LIASKNFSAMEPNTVLQETSQKETAANLIDGKPVSKAIKDELKERVAGYTKAGHRQPGLAVLLIGDNSASEVYVKNKILACKQIGIDSHMHRFGGDVETKVVLECIRKLNEDEAIDGILVQLPLPKHLPTEEILDTVSHHKDVDGLHPYNLGFLFAGKAGLQPCTPKGIMALLAAYKVDIRGKQAVVIGRSNLVGKPIAALLLQKDATVTSCHSRTVDLPAVARTADILIVAMGQKAMVDKTWVKPGACVIDVGTHHWQDEKGESHISGDVNFADVQPVAGLITPVPGCVGKMTVAMLMANTVFAYEKRLKLTKD
jgi:methylenetetrahydrofolate dehydrogenase (NADP+)/methenyltetrahydrofolate cyclohydrolase